MDKLIAIALLFFTTVAFSQEMKMSGEMEHSKSKKSETSISKKYKKKSSPVLVTSGDSTAFKKAETDQSVLRSVTNRLKTAVTVSPIKKTITAGLPKTIRYDLYVDDTIVTYTGRKRRAIAINGSIPAPTLYFTQGDTAEIHVHNKMRHETSIHWHGIILPNEHDGVPYLTTAPIKPGETHIFKFPIVQNGTYWYHSHTKVQEQSGMYGALIFYKREEPDIKQLPLVLSEWSDMRPHEIDRSLHNQTDWFGIRKNSVQSYGESILKGHFKTKLTNEWKRMTAMDVSDVAYDRFFINGVTDNEQPQYKPGEKVLLRIVNGGASSYFWVNWAGGKMMVVGNDGNDVQPVEVDRFIVGVAETYDVIVTIPDTGSYELLVTPEDRTKHASLWLGQGTKKFAPLLSKLKYFEGMKMMNDMMAMNGNMKMMDGMKMSNQIMDMNTVMYPEITGAEKSRKKKKRKESMNKGHDMRNMAPEAKEEDKDIVTLNYSMLRAPSKTNLPGWPTRTFYFVLTGNMNRYVWTLDNKTVSESDKILIHRGENIRVILFNNTMMRHPMHLHGHDFRLLNGQGDYAPMKNVLDIMPMEIDTFEFAGTETGDWFFHCHILYHMMSGMGRIFSYANSPANSQLPNPKAAIRKLNRDDRMFHFMTEIGLEFNGSDGRAMFANTRYKFETMWHLGVHPAHGFESETSIGRYFGKMQWLYVFVGFDYHYKKQMPGGESMWWHSLIGKNIFGSDYRTLLGQVSNKENRHTGVIGIQYTMPMLVIGEVRVDLDGKIRLQLSREDIPLTRRLRMNFMVNTDKEYAVGLRYAINKYFSVSTHYDSDMGLGAGVTIIY